MKKKQEKIKEITGKEKEKNENNVYTLEQIYEKFETIYKANMVHVTQILMSLNALEKDIKSELDQYWMKELPLKKTFDNYAINISNLIGTYNQIDEAIKKTFQEITSSLSYPEIDKVIETYEELLAEYKMKSNELIKKLDERNEKLKEDYEKKMEELVIKKCAEIHRQYEPLIEQMEKEIRDKTVRIREVEHLLLVNANKYRKDIDETTDFKTQSVLEAYFSDKNLAEIETELDTKIPFSILEYAFDAGIFENVGKNERQDMRREIFFKIVLLVAKKKQNYGEVKERLIEDYGEKIGESYLHELLEKDWIRKSGKGTNCDIILPLDFKEIKKVKDKDGKEK